MRSLTSALTTAMNDGQRQPAYKLYAYDPSIYTMAEVIAGSATPYDISTYTSTIKFSDTQISFVLLDPGGLFHPDWGVAKMYLGDGAIIRLKEGDSRVPESNWVWTFTGFIRGQTGWQLNRSRKQMECHVTAYARDNTVSYKKRKITTQSYTLGTEIGVVLNDVAKNYLGLTDEEIKIPYSLGLQLLHQTTQIADMSPWEVIVAILQAVAKEPYFDGEGKLRCVDKNLSRSSNLLLLDYKKVVDYMIPAVNQDIINKVSLKFIDANLERVDGEYQSLGTASVTTGFFSKGEKLDCWWSEDHKQRASGTSMTVKKSVNSGLLPVGTERYSSQDDFHGRITVTVSKWVPILAVGMLALYLIMAIIPDLVITFGFIGSGGFTISVGRVIQAAAMIVILLIMMSLGSAQYEIWGTPFDYAYLEKTSIAIQYGVENFAENELELENNFIGSFDQADIVTTTELIWQRTIAIVRKMIMIDDLVVEKGDIIELPDQRRFLILAINKSIKRGESSLLELDGCKVLTV